MQLIGGFDEDQKIKNITKFKEIVSQLKVLGNW